MPNPTHALTSRDYWMIGLVVAIILLSATRWVREVFGAAWFALRHGFKRKTPDSTQDSRYAVSGGPFAGSSFTYSGRTYPLLREVTDSPARPDLFGNEWRRLRREQTPTRWTSYWWFPNAPKVHQYGGHENLWGDPFGRMVSPCPRRVAADEYNRVRRENQKRCSHPYGFSLGVCPMCLAVFDQIGG